MRTQIVVFLTILLCSIAWGQSTSSSSNNAQSDQSMPGMDMSHHDMSNMKDMPMGGKAIKMPTPKPARTSCTPWKATWTWART